MERDSHDSVGEVKRFLDPVAVVHIDVNVEDTGVIPSELGKLNISRNILKELKNGDDNIVHVTKSGGFEFLGVM